MNAREIISDYYEALRRGEPLAPYFAERPDVVKVGVFSRRVGYEDVAEGFREQGRRTADWTVESHDLRVDEDDRHARFSDRVDLAWTDTVDGVSYAFDTRWTGTLRARTDGQGWAVVDMHVSAPHDRTPTADST
jgi:hypothetical protein